MRLRLRIESYVLHVVARVGLRVSPPLRAKRITDRFGRALRPIAPEDAGDVLRALGGTGTCLTRALAVAARLDGAEVVFNVVPPRYARATGAEEGDPPLFAHAWVEHRGIRIGDGGTDTTYEVARLR